MCFSIKYSKSLSLKQIPWFSMFSAYLQWTMPVCYQTPRKCFINRSTYWINEFYVIALHIPKCRDRTVNLSCISIPLKRYNRFIKGTVWLRRGNSQLEPSSNVNNIVFCQDLSFYLHENIGFNWMLSVIVLDHMISSSECLIRW